MATACDIRVCTADAAFCLKEAAVGFVADVGVLQRIPGIVGQGIAREMAYTARPIDAQRAHEIHLVNRVFADRDALMEGAGKLALQIAENAPLAVQASKDVLNHGSGRSIADGLEYVAAISSNIVPSGDLIEAMTAFMEKRKPRFSGR
jgi:enoyl-CoA hydratase